MALEPFAPLSTRPGLSFNPALLEALGDADLDALSFGVIALDREGTVLRYNQYESRLARLDRNQVIGRNFFREVAPCTRSAEFEGRFQRYAASNSQQPERFQYVFDFKFGAQDVAVELLRPSELERYYFLINRTQFRDVRAEGVPAPLQSELSPGEAQLGVRRDSAEQRIVQLPSVFFSGLRATCDRLAPETWPMFCYDWGVEWGRRAAIDLDANVFQTEGKALSELSMRRVAELLAAWFRELGLGSPVLDFSFAASGCLVVELQRSALAEATPPRSSASTTGRREQCSLFSGCLSALLSHVGGRRLSVRELRCGTGQSALCSFLVVPHARKPLLDQLLEGGERDVRLLVQRLSAKTEQAQ